MITFPSIEKISTCYYIDIFNFGLFPLVSLMEKIPQQQLFLPKFESSFVNKKYLDDQPAEFAKSHICSVCICNPQIYFPFLVFFLDSMGWKMIHFTVNKILFKKRPFLFKGLLLENCEPKICRIYEKIYFTACLLVYYYMLENKKSLSYSPIFLDIVKKCRKFDRTQFSLETLVFFLFQNLQLSEINIFFFSCRLLGVVDF